MAEWEKALPQLESAYKAWRDTKGSSADVWLALMADEVDFRSLAGNRLGIPWAKTHSSQAGVRQYLEGLTSEWTMDHYTVDRFVCQDDTIVMIGSTGWFNKSTGRKLETPKVDVWRFKDGKAVAFHEYFDTAAFAGCLAGPS